MTKGYKATYNYKCRNQIYEIGKEYKFIRSPVLCKRGFHYCLDAKNTLKYYPIGPDFKLLEIKDLNSNKTKIEDDKSCSNHIKVIREIVDEQEQLKLIGCSWNYCENNKTLTIKYSNGNCEERTYDENGNRLTCKDSTGYWSERTYDENGNELTYKDSTGWSYEYTYDSYGNVLSYKDSYDRWHQRTYDENRKLLTHEDSTNYWYEHTYNKNGNELTFKNSNGYWRECTYNKKGQKLTHKDVDGLTEYKYGFKKLVEYIKSKITRKQQ